MLYNVKVADYEGVLNVSYYNTPYERDKEKGDNENDMFSKKNLRSDKSNAEVGMVCTWHNSKTGKVEIVPEGCHVDINPFDMTTCLAIDEEFAKYVSDEFLPVYDTNAMAKIAQKAMEECQGITRYRKSMDNMKRAKKNIYEISKANKWDLFVTLTVADKEKRYNYDEVRKMVRTKIGHLRTRNKLDFGYLLIEEPHKDGAWHFHGLFNNIDGLTLTKARNPKKNNRLLKDKRGRQKYNIEQFKSIGHNECTYVGDTVAVAKYITKYVTKQLVRDYAGKHLYLCSKGLNRATVLYEELESLEHLPELLEKITGYVPDKVYEKTTQNPYNGTEIRYMEFKK
jgi:hypothetical protein